MPATQSNKAKIAKRVVEVLDYFDHEHQTATVMDIVRRYGRPQSSTSELLSSLVELGLLYKDLETRSYTLTPRAAILGSLAQPDFVRDGRLNRLVDRLAEQTHVSVGIFGVVGLESQIFCWHNGEPPLKSSNPKGIFGGMQEHLTNTAAGLLLLSTIEKSRREGMIRRLNAEASDENKFDYREMVEKVERARDCGFAIGRMGYGSIADCCAVLIPGNGETRPLALGLVYEPGESANPEEFIAMLRDAVRECETSTYDEGEIFSAAA
ncbi:helix-turn-helix domain-containing protein [Pontixanthobacter aquaemixtae]|uniref:Helix-turn-helix domain-containing protein n=1 Tax=Pontixanthobacter aquaemixtae TaxID=1958940 RepID=A0A844ZT49_9SPHN|nr:helix-turn-helix domain-containing protein [Pontixanthobacter aquaemixtae]MXO89987.1 helix-turn-helix domain-containing protein [Pontixanthobacter aquaemixtae]